MEFTTYQFWLEFHKVNSNEPSNKNKNLIHYENEKKIKTGN